MGLQGQYKIYFAADSLWGENWTSGFLLKGLYITRIIKDMR